jgi:hypothetical protein
MDNGKRESVSDVAPYLQVYFPRLDLGFTGRVVCSIVRRIPALLHLP